MAVVPFQPSALFSTQLPLVHEFGVDHYDCACELYQKGYQNNGDIKNPYPMFYFIHKYASTEPLSEEEKHGLENWLGLYSHQFRMKLVKEYGECVMCKKKASMDCSNCGCAFYCSIECQMKDKINHDTYCSTLKNLESYTNKMNVRFLAAKARQQKECLDLNHPVSPIGYDVLTIEGEETKDFAIFMANTYYEQLKSKEDWIRFLIIYLRQQKSVLIAPVDVNRFPDWCKRFVTHK